MSRQGPRVRVRDGKGNAIPGLYRRDGKYIAGYQENGRWRMVTLKATSVTEAKRERASLVVGLREGRIASADGSTFAEVFAEWQAGRRIAERTAEHERHLLDRHLATFKGQKVQKITASEVARVLRSMRNDGLVRMDLLCRVPDRQGRVRARGTARDPHEEPGRWPDRRRAAEAEEREGDRAAGQRNTPEADRRRTHGAMEGRIRARGPRRATHRRGPRAPVGRHRPPGQDDQRQPFASPDGSAKATKTEAGARIVPLFPELRQLLLTWKLRSPFTDPDDYVIVTGSRGPVQQRNAQRALAKAKAGGGARLARRPPLMAQPPAQRRFGLADRVRPRGDDRERDDGPREPGVHPRLLRA